MSVIYNRHAEQNPSNQKGDIDSSPTFQSDSAQDVRIASHDATVHTHTEFHHGHFHADVSHHAGGHHLLQVQNLCVGFTMYEEDKDVWRCSFRSDGKWVNVNELLQPFGGGGHISAAGLKYKTDNVEELKNRILDRVEELCARKQK